MMIDGAFFAGLKTHTRFVLARHGESEGNAAGIFQGRAEYPLTDRGRSQAAALGRSLAVHAPAVVFCSPLARARDTARIAAETAGFTPPTPLDALTELETGSFTGKKWAEVRHDDPEAWRGFRRSSWEGVVGAERAERLYDRAIEAWRLLRDAAMRACETAEGTATNVVAVTHGGFLQWLVRATFGHRSWFPLLPIENCCEYRLRVEPVTEDHANLFWEELGTRIEVDL
jgi:broad specificity phosphatase PhoE